MSARQRFGVGEVVFGVILTPVGDLRATFFWFFGVLEGPWNFHRFGMISGHPHDLRQLTKWRVKSLVQLGTKQQFINILAVKYKV